MKQETKLTIDWIKKQINLAKENCIDSCHKDGYPEYEADYEKAMNFLDSLPEIEKHLSQGGYIQDDNGTPCCHGDKVIVDMYGKKVYTLEWNSEQRCFCFVRPYDNGYKSINTLGVNFFTKVVEKDGL